MASKHLEPWQQILWSEDAQRTMARDYGLFYTHTQRLDKAIQYYNKALEIKSDDAKSLYYRSLCKKFMALSKSSLEDALAAYANSTKNQGISLQKCGAMYDINDFELSGVELITEKAKFHGQKELEFINQFEIIEENLSDSLGESLHQFIQVSKDHFHKVKELQWLAEHPDPRPMWQILRHEDKCDVVSIQEKVEELVHPIERARRIRGLRTFNQQYLKSGWIDIPFMKSLKDSKTLLLPQSSATPKLKEVVDNNYDRVVEFMKMLESRDPLYNINFTRFKNKKKSAEQQEATLNRIQYRTRRLMVIAINETRRLRSEGKTEQLSKYVEAFMGDYLILKTNRVAPWKFEYINEIYNTLGLAYMDKLVCPPNLYNCLGNFQKLCALLKIHTQEEVSFPKFVFGQRKTWVEPEAIDNNFIRYKKLVKRLEKRLKFANYSIEKCYIYYEIAKKHLEHLKIDECCSVARKLVNESSSGCKNLLWEFLGQFIICKANIVKNKIESAKKIVEELKVIVKSLKSEQIEDYVTLMDILLDQELSIKQASIARKKTSMMSTRSITTFGQSQLSSSNSNNI
ncbi:hypothetical protein ACFFRR_002709 [Megaselia abdita]